MRWAERALGFARVPLAGLGVAAIDMLTERLADAAPGIASAVLALVDSPRWPRDLDWSRGAHPRNPAPHARELDAAMRGVYRRLAAAGRRSGARRAGTRALSMFPTPPCAYFVRCARDPRCKPHLAAIARELFGALLDGALGDGAKAPGGGAIFTRFMLAGFATYRALERLGVPAFESYPDLQFRLSAPSIEIVPKRMHARALAARRRVVGRLAAELRLRIAPAPLSLDRADAAILALAAARAVRRGALAVAENPREGRFMFALDAAQARRLGLGRA